MRVLLLAMALLMIQLGPSAAEDIYIKNRLFKGQVTGEGMGASLALEDLAKALDLPLTPGPEFYQLGDYRVRFWKGDEGTVYGRLSELKNAGITVVQNPTLKTIDISLRDPQPQVVHNTGMALPPGLNLPAGLVRRSQPWPKLVYF